MMLNNGLKHLSVSKVYAEKNPPSRRNQENNKKLRKYRLLSNKVPELFYCWIECTKEKERTKDQITLVVEPDGWKDVSLNYKHLINKTTYIDVSKNLFLSLSNQNDVERMRKFTYVSALYDKDFKKILSFRENIHKAMSNSTNNELYSTLITVAQREEVRDFLENLVEGKS